MAQRGGGRAPHHVLRMDDQAGQWLGGRFTIAAHTGDRVYDVHQGDGILRVQRLDQGGDGGCADACQCIAGCPAHAEVRVVERLYEGRNGFGGRGIAPGQRHGRMHAGAPVGIGERLCGGCSSRARDPRGRARYQGEEGAEQ